MPDDATPPLDELAKRRADGTPREKPGTKKGQKETSARGSVSGPRAITAKQRQADAIALRLAGANLAAIAKQVGYATPSGAHQAIMAGISEMLPDETRNEMRSREHATLDRLQSANWGAALMGDDKAATIVLRCIDRRCKLLGLDAPVQLDVRVREGELVRVEFLDVLNDQTLAALMPLQDEMVRLSELRAGVIDVEGVEEAAE